jgi:hypothetical protein
MGAHGDEPLREQLLVRNIHAVIVPAEQGRDTRQEAFDRINPAAAPREDLLGMLGGEGRNGRRDVLESERLHDLAALELVFVPVLHRQHERRSVHQFLHPRSERNLEHLVLG